MKFEIDETNNPSDPIEFPWIGVAMNEGDFGDIVLFVRDRYEQLVGTVIGNIEGVPVNGLGYSSITWKLADFKKFNGKITLSND